MSPWRQALYAHARAFLTHEAFQLDPTSISAAEAAELWSVLDHMVRALQARKEQVRQVLLREAEATGRPTEGNGQKLTLGSTTVYRKVSGGHGYLRDPTVTLFRERGLSTVGLVVPKTAKVTYTVSAPLVDQFHHHGFITLSELESLREPPTIALQVVEATALLDELDAEVPRLPGQARRGGSGE